MKPALRFSGVVKHYGDQAVVDRFDLETEAGESVGLIGVNGAGKTTLIKCLLDLTALDAGHIEVFGVTHRDPDARSHLTYLAEHFIPPYYATGDELLRFLCHLHGVQYDRRRAEVEAEKLDLDLDALSKRVRAYSKGMSQKLGLVACLLTRRPLFVLDEPMSGLDPKARASFLNRLLELKQSGDSLFFSTHLLSDVESICDRIAVLHSGALRFFGTIDEFVREQNATDLEGAYLRCVDGHASR
jgi:ABC-2 type transport system ATP-binding protein